MRFYYICGVIIILFLSHIAGQDNLTQNGDDDHDETDYMRAVSEKPFKVVHQLQPGEREYLSPNLLGLQNIAVTFLPLSMNFLNVIDAFREIVNGVRYEILLNAVNTLNNDEETVCRLVILEKPWLRTQWGDKVRVLQYTNCSVEADGADMFSTPQTTLSLSDDNDRYLKNPFSVGSSRNELSINELKRLEDQIFPSVISSKGFTSKAATTIKKTATSNTMVTEDIQLPHPTTTIVNTENLEQEENVNVPKSDRETPLQTENMGTVPELSEDDKQWLDNFFTISAYTFENDNSRNNEMIQDERAPLRRSKRSSNHILENVKKLNSGEAKKYINSALTSLAINHGLNYNLLHIHKAYKKIVSGILTIIDCDLEGVNGKMEHCNVEIWSQHWRPVNATEITIKCPNEELIKRRVSRSVENAEKKMHKKRNLHNLNKVEHLFAKYQLKYKRKYQTTAEKQMRFRIFTENIKLIDQLNRHEMGSAKYGITEFADLTTKEYKYRTGLLPRDDKRNSTSNSRTTVIPNIELPKEFDWRNKGVVSKVKNQGLCGSCWAFSVTGNIESLHAIKTGNLEEYSEQELLDCDTKDSACTGGLPDNAYEAIKKIGGLELESDYPYHARKEKCDFQSSKAHVYVKDHVDLPKNEKALAQWLIANGPFSIGVNANAMQFYRGGVSHPWHWLCSRKNLEHGVLIVGYGVSEYPNKTLPYWIIKNSWGTKWGEQGYYRLYRGDNSCGVSEMASSAILRD